MKKLLTLAIVASLSQFAIAGTCVHPMTQPNDSVFFGGNMTNFWFCANDVDKSTITGQIAGEYLLTFDIHQMYIWSGSAWVAPTNGQVATYNASHGQYEFANLPTASRTFGNTTRSLNTVFQVSATQDALVSYGVDIAATLSLTTGQTGTVLLQYADNSGFTTNVVTVQSSTNGNTGTLAIGLGLTQTNTSTLTGMIPAGKYVQIITQNTTGTPTFTYRSGQEVLF